jgi:hypothetical protein
MRWPNNYQTFFILFNPVDLPGRTVKYQAAWILPLDFRSGAAGSWICCILAADWHKKTSSRWLPL